MPAKKKPTEREQELLRQVEQLRLQSEEQQLRLTEAEETLRAIREGEVDAVVVSGSKGDQIFSLVGTDSIYRLIVETMKEAAFTVTFDGKILFCNAQFGQLLKRPLELVVGHPLQEFVAESNRAAASSLLTATQQQPVRQRLVFQDLNCTSVPAHVSANVLNQPDGLSICVVASDLTELENSTELIQQLRRQQEALQAANEELAATEEELRVQNEELAASRAELDRTRARYQDLFETAPDGYLVTDPEGTIHEANQAAAHLLGRSAAELRGNPFSALLPSTDRESYIQLLSALSAGTVPQRKWEVEIRPLAGPRFWASVTAAASCDEEGRIVGLRWLLRDVTDRKMAEEELRHTAAMLEAIGNSTPDSIFVKDIDGRMLYASPGTLRAVNRTADQVLGRIDTEWHPNREEALILMANDRQVIESGQSQVIEEVFTDSQGKHIFLSTKSPLLDAAGQMVGLVGLSRDITEYKRTEEALRHAAEDLARSNTDLEQFAYVAGHDLQEPLRMVTGFLKLLRDRYKGKLDAKADEYIDFSCDGADRMSTMIGHLLDYARVSSRGMSQAPVDFGEIVRWVQANLQTSIQETKAVITHDPLPTATADAGQMSQVFQNLISNALKFRVEGRCPKVHIGARQENGAWIFRVKDNGIGIDPKQADRLFRLFQRLHTRDKYPGTGIGLAICKKIVERHGGRIWVESKPGTGSTFCFSLPAETK